MGTVWGCELLLVLGAVKPAADQALCPRCPSALPSFSQGGLMDEEGGKRELIIDGE